MSSRHHLQFLKTPSVTDIYINTGGGKPIPNGRAMEVKHGQWVAIRDQYPPMKGVTRPPPTELYVPSGNYLALGDFWCNEPKELKDVERLLNACNRSYMTRAEAGIIGSMWSIFLPIEEVGRIPDIFHFCENMRHPINLRSFSV